MKKSQSYRYCVTCREMRLFELNKRIGHSECTDCASRFALKDKEIIKKRLLKQRDNKLKLAEQWYVQQIKLYQKMVYMEK